MSIWITGDIHGFQNINKLSARWWPEGKNLTKSDYVIICGDFGLLWCNSPDRRALKSKAQERRIRKQYYLDVDGVTVCKISATHLKAAVYTTLQVIKDKQKEDPKFNPSILTIYKKDSTQSLKGDFNGQVNFCSA